MAALLIATQGDVAQAACEPWESAAEVQTADFIIKTNLPRGLKTELLRQADYLLEQAERVVGDVLDLSPRGPHKFRLSLFATRAEYQAYVGAIMTPSLRASIVEHSDGFFSGARNELVVSCPQKTFRECRATLVHEFAHALAGRTSFMAGGERVSWSYLLPPWLDEGLAEYVSVRVNHGQTQHVATLGSALQTDTLMALGDLINTQARPLEDPLFYPSAWSLVTFLLDDDDSKLRKQVKAYLQLLKTRRYATDQFESAFGDPQALERNWRQFIERLAGA
jgi:hypothetical protein